MSEGQEDDAPVGAGEVSEAMERMRVRMKQALRAIGRAELPVRIERDDSSGVAGLIVMTIGDSMDVHALRTGDVRTIMIDPRPKEAGGTGINVLAHCPPGEGGGSEASPENWEGYPCTPPMGCILDAMKAAVL